MEDARITKNDTRSLMEDGRLMMEDAWMTVETAGIFMMTEEKLHATKKINLKESKMLILS